MQSAYLIEDLVHQTSDLVVYRARNKNGTPYAINRFKFPAEILEGLAGGKFVEAYKELLAFDHPCIRTVIDGGQDPVDEFPWVATKWWNGTLLSNRIKEGPLTGLELQRIRLHAESLIETFGEKAACISFEPQRIVITKDSEGGLIDTFVIDYVAWFRDWSLGFPPGRNRDPRKELEKMMATLQPHPSPTDVRIAQTTTPAVIPTKNELPASPAVPTSPAVPSAQMSPAPVHEIVLPSSGSLKATVAILAIIIVIFGGLLWYKSQPSKEESQAENSPTDNAQNGIETSSPSTTQAPDPPRPQSLEPPRPDEDDILHIESNNFSDLKKSVGQWVYVEGEIAQIDEEQTIHLKESVLKATLKFGSVSLDPGTKVNIVGILKSLTHLEVPDNTNVQIHIEKKIYPPKEIYGVGDEEQLRTMEGETATVSGEILDYRTSGTGKTFYLLLKDHKPEFAFSIRSGLAVTEELYPAYLKSLIGKKVKITGSIKVDGSGGRLNIYYESKSDLIISEG